MVSVTAFERALNVCNYILKNIMPCLCKILRCMACSEHFGICLSLNIGEKNCNVFWI